MTISRQSWIGFSAAVALLGPGCAPEREPVPEMTAWQVASTDLAAVPGWGYRSDSGMLGLPCVEGRVETIALERASVDFQTGLDERHAYEIAGAQRSAHAKFRAFQGGASSSVARLIAEDETNLAFTYRVLYEKQKERLVHDETLDFVVEPGGLAWRQRCGDAVVAGKTVGGRLLMVLRITVASRETKQEVQKSLQARFGGLFGAGRELAEVVHSLSGDIQVSLHAAQVGGDASRLPEILRGVGEDTGSAGSEAVVHCITGDLDSCESFTQRVLDYAASSELAASMHQRAVDLSYETIPWADFGVAVQIPENRELFLTRHRLEQILDLNLWCVEHARERLSIRSFPAEQADALQQLERQCEENLELLAWPVEMCFDRLDPSDAASVERCIDALSTEQLASLGYREPDVTPIRDAEGRQDACAPDDPAAVTVYVDGDADGYGDPDQPVYVCDGLARLGTAPNALDCCDLDARAYPGAQSHQTVRTACGSNDFDCDATVSVLHSYPLGVCSQVPIREGCTRTFWDRAIPTCGNRDWIQTCRAPDPNNDSESSSGTCLVASRREIAQECR